MSDAVNILSKKRLNEFKQTVINDVIDLILNTITKQTSFSKKDRTYTSKRLTNTIEELYKILGDIDNDQFPSNIISSLKPHITTQLSNTFCFKSRSKNNKNKNLSEDVSLIFSSYIPQAIEVSFREIKKNVKLQKLPEYYRFFVFPLIINEKKYIITYAEENKYSKREIIEILQDNVEIDKNELSAEIKLKYNLM